MDFLNIEDYKAVVEPRTLDVIHQTDSANLERAERYAQEEICSYLRSRFDMESAFSQTGENRNQQLIMIAVDVSLYHLISWLPMKSGYEIRDIRYKRAIEWLESVQKGQATPDLPPLTDSETGENIGNPIKWGSMEQGTYDY